MAARRRVPTAQAEGETSPSVAPDTQKPDLSARGTWLAAWPGLLLASAVLLPFLGKAHAIDDVTFLSQAKHVLHDPWHPTAFEMVADGHRLRLSSALATGPVMAWLLVPCVLLGGAEWVAHLLQWLLVCVVIFCTVRIGIRIGLGRSPARLAGLLVAGYPAMIGMATTSMSDVPAGAFAALAMERFLAWHEERRPLQGAAAAMAFACAGLARSHALVLPLVALALLGGPADRRRRWTDALPLAVSWIVAYLVMLLTADPAAAHGTMLDAMRGRGLSPNWRGNLAAFGCHWLATIPLAIPWLWARGSRLVRDVWSWLLFAVAGAYLLSAPVPPMPAPVAAATALAFAALVDVVRDARSRGDRVQMMLGAWLLPALTALLYVHLPCKLLLVSAPAAALLTARLIDRADARLPMAVAGALVAAGATLGVLIVLADSEFTDAGRRAAKLIVQPAVRAGVPVRFYGAWGAQWYAMQAGAEVAAESDPDPEPGEILVVSASTPGATPRSLVGLEAVGEMGMASHFGRVISGPDDVGFYSNGFGYLPWTWRNGPIERFTVWRVRAATPAPGRSR